MVVVVASMFLSWVLEDIEHVFSVLRSCQNFFAERSEGIYCVGFAFLCGGKIVNKQGGSGGRCSVRWCAEVSSFGG